MSTGVGTESEAQIAGETGERGTLRLTRMVNAPVAHVWEVLVSPPGAAALLGEGAVLGAKGDPYHCTNGSSGVLRSYHPLEQLRVSYHPTPGSAPSIIEVDLRGENSVTVIELRHDRIVDDMQRESLQEHWNAALDALVALAS